MGVELIRKAVCDRCGKECYHIVETILNEETLEQYKVKRSRIVENIYHYTELSLRGYDSRFENNSETKIVLCGKCVNDLGDWLKVENGVLK